MNKCIFVGRTTRDIELRYTTGEKQTAVAKFSIATDSGYGDNKKTNFFNMTAWGKTAETLEKYAKKGTKLILECQAVQNQYTDKNGNNVNTVDFTVLNFEFAESRSASQQNNNAQSNQPQTQQMSITNDGFMNIPDNIGDEGLPFN